MTNTTWAMLRDLLVDRYDELRRRLAWRLGSAELATEILHETWLRLARRGSASLVQSPNSYIWRVALNVAYDRRLVQSRLASSDIEALWRIDDEVLDPERIAAARSEIKALKQVLDELPPRCRSIFVAARVEGEPHADIAKRLGISTRMVERELARAFDLFETQLEKGRSGMSDRDRPDSLSLQEEAADKASSSTRDRRGSRHHD